eukprot:Gregarina_sp_Pseudo_9__696@NODE_1442_length_1598_cov_331_486209_g1339_i0_p3_GENE_NODE_1442_length_1598_cov_331_486209_g1339_i0NODE_1442_length_1598_cov_331_486209_g1339_i0_p3_ORF_typecomplete_len126_score17_37_NODE_1442_length_1598_cov_331_486209_g1339_i0149526
MSVVLKNSRPVLQRYDVQWEEDPATVGKCPLRNISQISECVWVSSRIMHEEEDDYLHTQQKYIPSSEAAKRRAKFFYCQFKEKLSSRRVPKGDSGQRHSLAEKVAHALGSVTHTNGLIPVQGNMV